MTVHLFGAGASYGTFGSKAPLARQFGRCLESEVPDWATKFPALARVAAHLARPIDQLGLVELWTCIDYYAKLQDAIGPNSKPWRGESKEIKRAVLAVYGRKCDELAKHLSLAAAGTIASLVRQLRPGDVVASFNYDTIVERLMVSHGHDVRSADHPEGNEAIWFSKPHGSASWIMRFKPNTIERSRPGDPPLLESMDERTVAVDREPLVLGAVPMTSELIDAVQKHYGFREIFLTVAAQWRLMIDGIANADRVVVVGYGFPREDSYGRFLFGEAIRRRNTSTRIKLHI